MEDEAAEIREKVENGVQELIDVISVNRDEVPTEEISYDTQVAEDPPTWETQVEEIPRPSQVVSDYKKAGSFEEISTWLYNEHDILAEQRVITRSESGIKIDTEEVQNDADRIDIIERQLRTITGSVMDYNGGFEFSEEAFDSVYKSWKDQIIDDIIDYNIIYPLYNFECDTDDILLDENVSLPLRKDFDDDIYENEINTLRIVKLSRYEKAEIDDVSSKSHRPSNHLSHAIKVNISGQVPFMPDDLLSSKVELLLRLYKPKSDIEMGTRYKERPLWQSGNPEQVSYRTDYVIPDLDRSTSARRIEPFEMFSLSENELDELAEFWEEYASSIPYLPFVDEDYELTRPLQRFELMYEKTRVEDAIIDCNIAFETTLIKDGGSIAERGVVLLEDVDKGAPYIYDFLDSLWDTRNKIVHEGAEIGNIEIREENHTPDEFVKQAKFFLARSILEYIDLKDENPSMNVTEINRDILRPKIASRLKSEPSAT